MPRTCTVCTHEQREAIDRALVAGGALRSIAQRYGPSATALFRHKAEHLPAMLVKAQEAQEVAEAGSLLEQLRGLQRRTLALLDKAEAAGRLSTAVMAVREARGNIELLAELTEQLDRRPVTNILIAPEWVCVRAALVATLAPYPEARAAVGAALLQLEAGNGHR